MCGLVGIAGKINQKHEKAMRNLLILDSLRGVDSTGIGVIGFNGDVKIAKQLGNPYELFEYKSFEKSLHGFNRVMIGHNRWATVGGVSKAAAHPFLVGNIIGAHNGTLESKYALEDAADFKVDSENLFHHINKRGLDSALGSLRGAWSLVWWDTQESTLNFLRNKERPMFYSFDETGAIWWASEPWMLKITAGRDGVKITDPEETLVDHHYSLPVDNTGVVGEFVIKKAESRAVVHNHVFQNGVSGTRHNRVQQLAAPRPNTSITPTGRVIEFPEKPVEPKNLGVTPPSVKAFINTYANSKSVLLNVTKVCKDQNGATYLECCDQMYPYAEIRLFMKKHDKPEKYIDCDIYADIGKYHLPAGKNYGFFKAEYNSFKLAKPLVEQGKLFTDIEGELLEEGAWIAKHGTCCWCSGPVFPVDPHKFVQSGGNDPLCETCMDNEEVQQYCK